MFTTVSSLAPNVGSLEYSKQPYSEATIPICREPDGCIQMNQDLPNPIQKAQGAKTYRKVDHHKHEGPSVTKPSNTSQGMKIWVGLRIRILGYAT